MFTTLLFLISSQLLLVSCGPINTTVLESGRRVMKVAGPELSPDDNPMPPLGSPAAYYNPNNRTCASLNGLNASAQWQAVDGDSVIRNLNDFFVQNKLICKECFGWGKQGCKNANSTECQKGGLKDQSIVNGVARYDRAAFIFAGVQIQSNFQCSIPSQDCTAPANCLDSVNGPGTFLMLQSFETFSEVLGNWDDLLKDASSALDHQMLATPDLFADTFAPKWERQVDHTTFEYWSNQNFLFLQQTYVNASNDFSTFGSYGWNQNGGKGEITLTFASLTPNGALIVPPPQPPNTLQLLSQILLQQLAVSTWAYVAKDNVGHLPYITYDTAPCPAVNPHALGSLNRNALFKNVDMASGITIDGNCYYLLDAIPGGHKSEYCYGVNPPAGATNATLTKNAAAFSGLSVADWVVPSVKGFVGNNNVNGYPRAMENGVVVSDPQQEAVVSIPVCDYVRNQNAPGKGCPQVGKKVAVNGKVKSCAVY